MDDMNLGALTPDVVNEREFANASMGAGQSFRNPMHSQPVSPKSGSANDWISVAGAAWPMAGRSQSTNASLPGSDDTHRNAIETINTTGFPSSGQYFKVGAQGGVCEQQRSPNSESCRTACSSYPFSRTGSDTTSSSTHSPMDGSAWQQRSQAGNNNKLIAAQIQELKSMLSIMSVQDEAKITRLED